VIAFLLPGTAAHAQFGGPPPAPLGTMERPVLLREVGIDQRLGDRVPLDARFRDEDGAEVPLGRYFGPHPVVLALVYYECPMLCTQVLNGLVAAVKTLSFTAGREFEVVVVSFDPRETPALARAKKDTYVRRYGRPGTAGAWHFLTGGEPAIASLTRATGFRYAYDDAAAQFAHAAAIAVLTPDGRIARYLFGIEYAPRDLRLAIVEASGGRIGSAIDQVLLFCYHYDPTTGAYGLAALNLVRAGGAATAIVITGYVFVSLRRERRARTRIPESRRVPGP
jgi:protein SCO1/2